MTTEDPKTDIEVRGWAALWQPPTKERTETARDYFEHATKIDPQSAEAMVGFAYARSHAITNGWTAAGDMAEHMRLEDLLAKAIGIGGALHGLGMGDATPRVTRRVGLMIAYLFLSAYSP